MSPAFTSKRLPAHAHPLAQKYRSALRKHPFALFGLPFITLMVAGSFFLTPATAVRFERFDRKTHMLDREEALGLRREWGEGQEDAGKSDINGKVEGDKRRLVGGNRDIREEYFRLAGRQSLNDDWEPKRVKRLPGEPDGTFD